MHPTISCRAEFFAGISGGTLPAVTGRLALNPAIAWHLHLAAVAREFGFLAAVPGHLHLSPAVAREYRSLAAVPGRLQLSPAVAREFGFLAAVPGHLQLFPAVA